MLKALEQRINHRYGSKRGFVRYYMHRGLDLAGRYRKYRQIDWDRVERLVFVCSGNICRSPLAERVALDAGYNATSFGLHCTPGRPADPRVVELARERGCDLSGHRTRLLKDAQLSATDLLVGMEPVHLVDEAAGQCTSSAQRTLLGRWEGLRPAYIHDPYSANEEYFARCTRLLIESTESLAIQCPRARQGWKTSMRSG